MPHIIVEYSKQLMDKPKVEASLKAVHQAVAESGLFEVSHIKTRAYSFESFTNADINAGETNPYIHIQARIKSGRDTENKKNLSQVILSGISAMNIPASVITVEIIDMDRASYGKHK